MGDRVNTAQYHVGPCHVLEIPKGSKIGEISKNFKILFEKFKKYFEEDFKIFRELDNIQSFWYFQTF